MQQKPGTREAARSKSYLPSFLLWHQLFPFPIQLSLLYGTHLDSPTASKFLSSSCQERLLTRFLQLGLKNIKFIFNTWTLIFLNTEKHSWCTWNKTSFCVFFFNLLMRLFLTFFFDIMFPSQQKSTGCPIPSPIPTGQKSPCCKDTSVAPEIWK